MIIKTDASNPSTETEVAEFAGQLFFRLARLAHPDRRGAGIRRPDASGALRGAQLPAGERGAIQQQIGSAMKIDPSTMVSLIDQLERAGLAKRTSARTAVPVRVLITAEEGVGP